MNPKPHDRGHRAQELRTRGLTWEQITAVWESDHPGTSPRVAFRWAHNLTQQQVAEACNALNPGEPTMTKSRISQFESWPAGGRRPSISNLNMLARIYQTTARRLLTEDEYLHYSAPARAELDRIDHRQLDDNCPTSMPQHIKHARQVREVDEAIGATSTGTSAGGSHLSSRPAAPMTTVDDVERKEFLRTALGIGAAAIVAPLTELAIPTQPSPLPTLISAADIQEIRTIADMFQAWDHTYGGSLVREAVVAQLRYAVSLLKQARCPNSLQPDLYTAVGYLGHAAAATSFDSCAHEDARRMFRLALACAEEAGNWHLRAKILSSMARQAIWCGDADSGLTLVELALVRSERLTPAERAMLLSARARALAKQGCIQDTLTTVGTADEEFSRVRPHEEPPWMRYYDAAQHAGDTGHAVYDLATRGNFIGEATQRLAAAVQGHTAAYVRSRAISGVKLASLTMATGDPREAAAIGERAVADGGTVRSRRAADDMKELYQLASAHEHITSVAELRHHIKGAVLV
ncbi:helix-turn-helix domain-containing protein [Sphaerisporangium sp. NPDC049003]|uniref:helix-turn-helix domain-containing protein n=1 Tax=Sphaerisporangium sp. NPDC049003 TaxID=3364517 RepID=UPI00371CED72